MLAVHALGLMLAIGQMAPISGWLPPPVTAAIPDEPGAMVLFDGPVHQAVAADLDGDGNREIVALTEDDGSAVDVIAWQETDGRWHQLGEPFSALPGAAGPEDVWRGWRVRLLLRSVGEEERVTLVSQPDLRSADEDGECCVRLDDLTLAPDGLRLTSVAPTRQAVEAVVVLDLDGDGTDEIVATRSVLPRGDVSYPTDVFVHRWIGEQFTVQEQRLPIGSGDSPFVLGDTDGEAGEELGIIATAGRPELHRIGLGGDGEELTVDDAGTVATAAMAVPLDDGRGVAVVHANGTLGVHAWPADGALSSPVGAVQAPRDVRFLGVVDVAGRPRLLATTPSQDDRLLVFDLPDPGAPPSRTIGTNPAARTLAGGPLDPYTGLLPGGFDDRLPAGIQTGRLIGVSSAPEGGIPFPTLVGAQPIGLAGSNDRQLAVLHGVSAPPLDTSGGRLDPPSPAAEAAISVASLGVVIQPEVDDARLDASISGGALGEGGMLFSGADGLVARIEAPPGSRVYVGAGDEVEETIAVPGDGVLDVPLAPPDSADDGPASRVGLTVTTPAGHSYRGAWDVRVLIEPPALEATTRTPVGAGQVEVAGTAPPYATVRVAGELVAVDAEGRFSTTVALPPWPTDVEIVATDPVGNSTARTVSGVGWLDYRDLPWIPIGAVGIAVAALVLYLRVPRREAELRRADDDAVLEELEGD